MVRLIDTLAEKQKFYIVDILIAEITLAFCFSKINPKPTGIEIVYF